MRILISILILGLLSFGLIRALNRKAMDIDRWQELDRGDGNKFKDWR